jgi:hypothetical protein
MSEMRLSDAHKALVGVDLIEEGERFLAST